ncbi:MAG: radical SAM protein [Clostridia bacterium]
MSGCTLCPRECGIDRKNSSGACGAMELPYIARADLHMWEEPFISGTRGSGTIFFCGCNLQCIFCQNHSISQGIIGHAADADLIAKTMLKLQEIGANNINLVTPTPHIDVIVPALQIAKDNGLIIPIVYNTNSYEKVDALRRLEGLIDIYLPDLKYVSGIASLKFSGAEDYFEYASKAVLEMQRQCGQLTVDNNGMAVRGIAIRHLVLPGCIDEARGVLNFIKANLPITTYISLMGQYVPCYKADNPPLNRRLLKSEYQRAIDYCCLLGFENVMIQEQDASSTEYTPDFNGYTVLDY